MKTLILLIVLLSIVSCATLEHTPIPFEPKGRVLAPYGDKVMTLRCKQQGISVEDCGN